MDSNCAAPKSAVRKEPQGSVQSGIYIHKGGRTRSYWTKSRLSVVGPLFFRGWREVYQANYLTDAD